MALKAKLPTADELLRNDVAGLLRQLRRFGVEIDEAALDAAADKAFERVGAALRAGVVLDAAAWEAIEKAVGSTIDLTTKKLMRGVIRDTRSGQARRISGKEIWITVADEGVCPDCDSRHGEEDTVAGWKRRGRPGSPATRCGELCRCELLPIPDVESNVDITFGGIL